MNTCTPITIKPLTEQCTDPIRLQRLQQCAASDLFRHVFPSEFGGLDTNYQQLVDHHQQLGVNTHDTGLVLAVNAHLWGAAFPIWRHGNTDQQQDLLPGLLDGSIIGGHAISESHSGSDPSVMLSNAEKTASGYILNGEKCYISNAAIADLLIIYVKMEQRVSAFIVHKHDPGVSIESTPMNSCRGASMGKIKLTHCELPSNRLLGKPGTGLALIQQALEYERAFIFAGIAGIMQWQLEQVISHSRQRRSGKTHLGKHQAISHPIADMNVRLETIKLWLKECARLCDNKQRISLLAAQTKLYASEAFLQSSLQAVHVLGAQGLNANNGLTELVNDAMAGRMFSGTSEIQKNIIAGLLGTGDGYQGST